MELRQRGPGVYERFPAFPTISAASHSLLTRTTVVHPHYGIYALGCSSKAYAVIEDMQDAVYADLIGIQTEDQWG